ncbi:MAG: hypothetical protein NTZ49_04155 [Candidatus Parcubacteria bacterium]|nr:hypothetical protein [Candidatus Parcubacteria bacterium]
MRPDFERLFTKLNSPQPPAELQAIIISRINALSNSRILKLKVVLFAVSSTVSAVAAVFAFMVFRSNLAETGFWQFFTLLFSDHEILMSYWQNYLMSLAESLPISSLVLLLVCTLAFCESVRLLANNAKKFRLNII